MLGKHARLHFCGAVAAIALSASWILLPVNTANAASQGILVVVNDHPITSRDVDQRLKLERALGDNSGSTKARKKQILKLLIDEVIAKSEAKRLGFSYKPAQINKQIEEMAKRINSSVDQLASQLRSKGVTLKALRDQVGNSLTYRWVIGRNVKTKVEVSDAELDRRYSKMTSDPRLRPVTVYQIREITLPIEQASEAMAQQLAYARAIEAQQIATKYKGCSSLKAASDGIFNVRIGKLFQAPADKLPAKMREVLKQAGTQKLIGPMRVKEGIRLIANCGLRTIRPPKPPKEVVRNMMLGEKYDKLADRVMRDLRRRAFIEYKDKSAF